MKNFEKYKTTAERVTAHKNWCDRHIEHCKERCGCCGIKWLDLEADEVRMPCPFCGGEVILAHNDYGQAYVGCQAFGCYYTYYENGLKDHDIIAAHNRVSKAVAAYNKKCEVKQ